MARLWSRDAWKEGSSGKAYKQDIELRLWDLSEGFDREEMVVGAGQVG